MRHSVQSTSLAHVAYWTLVTLLLAGATVFALLAEHDFRDQLGLSESRSAEIADGDLVRVVLVLNGDEILVEKGGRRARVRMLAIHSFDPVINEREITAFGDASVRFLSEWILNRTVRLVFDQPVKDERGRYLAYVIMEEIDVNQRMVEEGIAMVYTEFPTRNEQAYLIAEISPRRVHRGIWGGRKASARIVALRQTWAHARTERGNPPPVDPLLEEGLR